MARIERGLVIAYLSLLLGLMVLCIQVMNWSKFQRLVNKAYNKTQVMMQSVTDDELSK